MRTYGEGLIKERDLVRTKTGRQGVVRSVRGHDTAVVKWEDGEEFPIRCCHLQVIAHNCELPTAPFVQRRTKGF